MTDTLQEQMSAEADDFARRHFDADGDLIEDSASFSARGAGLMFRPLFDIIQESDTAPPREWLVEGIMAERQYGVLAAEDKAGKTWMALELAMSIASGKPWLGIHPVQKTGPVAVFFGEGDEDELVARWKAICERVDLDPKELSRQVQISLRVPALTSSAAMDAVRLELQMLRPTFVILDPLYLAARGANGSDLYAMGEVLGGLQEAVQDAECGLLVLTHFKKGEANDSFGRTSGVGPGAWGRFLIAASSLVRSEDEKTGGSYAKVKLEYRGGRIADASVTYERRVWQDDKSDLNSPMHITFTKVDDEPISKSEGNFRPTYLMARVSEHLIDSDSPMSGAAIEKAITGKATTVRTAYKLLLAEGYIEHVKGGYQSIQPFTDDDDGAAGGESPF